jgi:hemerythrin-like domain-containing protein
MIELKVINKEDPLKRKVEKQTEQEEFSPMDPPDAYSPPNMETVAYEKMHPFLQQLTDEHKACVKELDTFEETLIHIQQNGIDKTVNEKLSKFFEFFDDHIVKHNQKEEKILFPLLHQRLIENGEHGHGAVPITAADMLEDDHIKALQLAAVVFNFFGLVMRLPDPDSRLVVLDAALEQGTVLIELLRVHIFREDNIAFVQAHKFISEAEFDEMQIKMLTKNK